MKSPGVFAALTLGACLVATCSEPGPVFIFGSMEFVLGGTAGAATGPAQSAAGAQAGPLIAGDEYIVSPSQARLTFTSVVFLDEKGSERGESSFYNCTVTYNRSLVAGTTLLDCPFLAPVGEITEMRLYFNKTLDVLVSDATVGIYSDPLADTRYSTVAPPVVPRSCR